MCAKSAQEHIGLHAQLCILQNGPEGRLPFREPWVGIRELLQTLLLHSFGSSASVLHRQRLAGLLVCSFPRAQHMSHTPCCMLVPQSLQPLILPFPSLLRFPGHWPESNFQNFNGHQCARQSSSELVGQIWYWTHS